MKNALIWITVLLVILFVAGKTPKTAHEWLLIETGAVLFWCFAGFMLFARAVYRFVVRS